MIDWVIERWSGPALICAGVIAAGLGIGGLLELLPPPIGVPRGLRGTGAVTTVTKVLVFAGIAFTGWGISLYRHFRREQHDSSSTK